MKRIFIFCKNIRQYIHYSQFMGEKKVNEFIFTYIKIKLCCLNDTNLIYTLNT